MRRQLYKYQGEGVELSFSFPEDEKIVHRKAAFLVILRQALEELSKEVGEELSKKP